MTTKEKITYSLASPHHESIIATGIIDKLLKKNSGQKVWQKFSMDISYDYTLDFKNASYAGVYFMSEPGKIYINPTNIDMLSDALEEESSCVGYTKDISLLGVIIHEFCHLITYEIYSNILKDYKDLFPTNRNYLNSYSDETVADEIAEAMTLYITNPYLLKMIFPAVHKFFKDHFKSPMPCSLTFMKTMYDDYPISIKHELDKKWNIVYDVKQNIFVKRD